MVEIYVIQPALKAFVVVGTWQIILMESNPEISLFLI